MPIVAGHTSVIVLKWIEITNSFYDVFYCQGDNNEGRGGDTEDGTEANEGEDTQQPPPPPPGPSAFRIAMSFVSSFFTSLVPQHNDGIQGN